MIISPLVGIFLDITTTSFARIAIAMTNSPRSTYTAHKIMQLQSETSAVK